MFESIEDFKARIDDPDLDVDENCVLVLKGAGPRGYPGMPETGNLPLPPKLLAKGITDMVRISDARMSGTAYGTVVLHTSPEAAAGGTLALVQNGDHDRARRPERRGSTCSWTTPSSTRRRAAWQPPPPAFDAATPSSTSSTSWRRPRRRLRLPGRPQRRGVAREMH